MPYVTHLRHPSLFRRPLQFHWLGSTGPVKDETISGKYRLLRLLGEGAAGNVWAAENLLVGRHVAIKILHPSVASRPEMQQRFLAEARLSAKLAHPNVVDVYDLGRTDDGTPYIVMELLEGETLEKMLVRRRRLPPQFACELMMEVLGTLVAAHKLHIVHRDLKPANIMLVYPRPDQPLVKVLDFGVAQGIQAEGLPAEVGMLFGTPEYMAPEQATGAEVDARCDVYAAGAILYELIAGVAVFSGTSTTAVLSRVLSAQPEPLHNLAHDVPRDLEAVVMSALAKNPEGRPSSAKEMSSLISRFATKGYTGPMVQLSERPMMLTQKKRQPKKKLELVVQSSVPPRPESRAPRQVTRTSTLKPPRKK
jgi:eukaryotic-like serine/threonine-protein kinase